MLRAVSVFNETLKSTPILSSAPDHSLGRIFVPRQFHSSGGIGAYHAQSPRLRDGRSGIDAHENLYDFRICCKQLGYNIVPFSFFQILCSYSHSFSSLYSMLSTSACHEASMIFSETPTVFHFCLSSPDSIRTRTFAEVPFPAVKTRTL